MKIDEKQKAIDALNREMRGCTACRLSSDLLVGVTAKKAEMKCRKCGSENIEKRFSTFSMGESRSMSSGSDSSCPTGTCPLG